MNHDPNATQRTIPIPKGAIAITKPSHGNRGGACIETSSPCGNGPEPRCRRTATTSRNVVSPTVTVSASVTPRALLPEETRSPLMVTSPSSAVTVMPVGSTRSSACSREVVGSLSWILPGPRPMRDSPRGSGNTVPLSGPESTMRWSVSRCRCEAFLLRPVVVFVSSRSKCFRYCAASFRRPGS